MIHTVDELVYSMYLLLIQLACMCEDVQSQSAMALYSTMKYPDTNNAMCITDDPAESHSSISRGQCVNACNILDWNWFNFIPADNSTKCDVGECQLFNVKPTTYAEVPNCSAYTRQNTELNDTTMCRPAITLVASLNGTSKAVATAVLNEQLFVTRAGANQVWVYDTTSFVLKHLITFPSLGGQLYGLATHGIDNYLIISDNANSLIHTVDLSATTTINVSSWSVSRSPGALSFSSAGTILAAIAKQDGGRVVEYTRNGTLVQQIIDDTPGQPLESSPGVWVYSRMDPKNDVVKTFSNGTKIKNYGPSIGLRQMTDPACMALDPLGYILVADSGNNRILVVNPSMTDVRELPLPANINLNTPLALSLDIARGRVYIGEGRGQYRVLVFDGITNIRVLFNN